MGEVDRRVRRTRKSVEDAFANLLNEKDYDAITVKDILERADVGRATFYAHYRDKEEVAVVRFLEMLEAVGLPAPSGPVPRLLPVKELFTHLEEVKGLKTFAVGGSGLSMYLEYGRRFWSKKLTVQADYLKKQKLIGSIPRSLFVQTAIGLLMNFLTWWLREPEKPSPEKMDLWYHAMIFGNGKNAARKTAVPDR